jgi:Rrf2 family nitric oxide-sensitive transcriptional repressor
MLSQTVEYALRAVVYLARRYPDPVRVAEIADAVEAPRNYLAKVLGALARADLLASSRGPSGGFELTRVPSSIALADVVAAVEGTEERQCLLGTGRCGDNPNCPAHRRWAPVANAVDDFFGKTTLADLLHPHASPEVTL